MLWGRRKRAEIRYLFTGLKRLKIFNPSHGKRLQGTADDGFGHADVL